MAGIACRLGRTRVLTESSPDKQKRPASRGTVPSATSSGIIRRCAPHPSSRGRRRCAPAFLACVAGSVERGFSPRARRINKNAQLGWAFCLLAESQGFEPWVRLPVQRISNPSHSTTLATLQVGAHLTSIRGQDGSLTAAVRPGDAQLLRRLRSRRQGPGGSGPCPSSCGFPCPTGGSRPG